MPNELVFTDGELVEQTVDNEDGSGTRTTYDAEGNVTGTENLTGLPIPEPPALTRADIEDAFAAALADAQTLEEVRQASATRNAAIAELGGV